MDELRCDVGGTYGEDSGGAAFFEPPCLMPPTHQFRREGFHPEGVWAYRCATHVRWLKAPGLTIEPLEAGE